MKTTKSLLGAAFVIAALGVIPAFAQNTMRVRADVPFEFSVGSVNLPAGEYVISSQMGSSVMRIAAARGNHQSLWFTKTTTTDSDPEEAHLTFHVYGQQYYLAAVWSGTGAGGLALPKSPAEKEAAASIAPKQVALLRVPARAAASR